MFFADILDRNSEEDSQLSVVAATVREDAQTHAASRLETATLSNDYLRIRDFQYAQPLYDLAYLLEVDAIAKVFSSADSVAQGDSVAEGHPLGRKSTSKK